MEYKVIAFALLCIALVTATGCLSLSNSGSTKTASPQEISYTGSGGIPSLADSAFKYSANSAPAAVPKPRTAQGGSSPVTIDTKIIKTAYINIEVQDVPGSVESISSLAKGSGGYVSSTNIQSGYNNRLSGTIEIRVPAAAFDATLSGIKSVGSVKSVSTQGQDVTEEYVDLQAQQASYQNQLAQYNAILKQSQKVEDIIAVQTQIDRVQTELDRLNGRLKYLDSRIDFSTITVNLQEPEPVGGETGHSFVSTINEGIAGFFGMIDAIIIILFSLLPLIIIGGVAYGIYRWKKSKIPAEPASDLTEKK